MYFSNLKNIRNDNDLTQKDVADKLGVNQFTYKNWENGIVMIPLKYIDQLSVIYNARLSYLLGLEKSYKTDYTVKEIDYNFLLNHLLKLKSEYKHSYSQIAQFLNCNKSTCCRYFEGKIPIPIDRLILLSELYKIDLDKLCGKE